MEPAGNAAKLFQKCSKVTGHDMHVMIWQRKEESGIFTKEYNGTASTSPITMGNLRLHDVQAICTLLYM